MRRYVLGIDGGGTKTEAAIQTTDGVVCGLGRSGSGNFDDVGIDVVGQHVREAVQAARAQAGLDDAPFAAAFLGMAGVVSEKDRAVVRSMAQRLRLAPPARIGVDHDCRIALAGGLSGRPGMVLILGTGSVCYGRNEDGAEWRAGGWGRLVSDEGSSYWLGLQAMTAAVRAFDGRGPRPAFVAPLMETLRLNEPEDIMHRLYVEGLSHSEIAGLAPLVTHAAREGDSLAQRLIEEGMRDVVRCAAAVSRRLELQDADVVLLGGLLRAGEVVERPLRAALSRRLPNCRPAEPEQPAAAGACLLARRHMAAQAGRLSPDWN